MTRRDKKKKEYIKNVYFVKINPNNIYFKKKILRKKYL